MSEDVKTFFWSSLIFSVETCKQEIAPPPPPPFQIFGHAPVKQGLFGKSELKKPTLNSAPD